MTLATPPGHLLLLAGSGEGREIAQALCATAQIRLSVSSHVSPRLPFPKGVGHRIGGFGGDAGMRTYLEAEGITAVLDATHPFADRISARVARLCDEMGLPSACVLRPPWGPEAGDDWCEVADVTAAAARIAPGQRVFTTTGRASLTGFAGCAAGHMFVRRLLPRTGSNPQMDMSCVTYVDDIGPFSVKDEVDTLRRLQIDVLVVKNSGGAASRTKLDAARQLGLPVILIARPPPPPGLILGEVSAALAWVDAL